MNWNRSASLASLVLVLGLAGCGNHKFPEADARKHYEKAGGFSFDPPEGWTAKDVSGSKYKALMGPVKDAFASNINIQEESYSGSISSYADANMKTLNKMFAGATVEKQEPFTTADGDAAVRAIVEDTQMGIKLRQTFYFFSNGSRKYVVTCSTLSKGGSGMDGLFETSMKTFRVH